MGVILDPITADYAVKELEQNLREAFRAKGYGYHASPNAEEEGVINIVAVRDEGGPALAFHIGAHSSRYDNGYSGPEVGFIITNPDVPGADKSPLKQGEQYALVDKEDAAHFVEDLERSREEGKPHFRNNLNKFPLFPY